MGHRKQMIFKQYKDGSCDIEFSKQERKIIHEKGKITLTAISLRHFGNNLMKIVAEFNKNFNKEIASTGTNQDSKIEGIDCNK